jgi:4'-phosphopantetheinyl transferase
VTAAPTFPAICPYVSTTTVAVRWLVLESVAPAHWSVLAHLLDDGERARAERFYFERDRQAYVAAHALARTLLSVQSPRPPKDWCFSANTHGKPEVVQGDIAHADAALPLRFNLSHTRGLVAVGVTLANDVGIDVEAIEPKRLGLELAERTFAPAEVALLRATPPDALPEALFAIWTLKEACIKAVGLGLAMPLEAFAVSLDPLAVDFAASLGENPGCWLLQRLAPTQDHTLALALRHPDPATVSIDAAGIEISDLVAAAGHFQPDAGEMSLR